MKVIEEQQFFAFTCEGCGSQLEAEPSDVCLAPYWEGAASCGGGYYFVECPICGEQKLFPDSRMTRKVKQAMAEKEKG